jgi:MFS family permease
MNQLDHAFERIAVGRHTPGDLALVREATTPGAPLITTVHDQYVRIGGRHYYGLDAIRIRAALTIAAGDQPPQPAAGSLPDRIGRALWIVGALAVAAGVALLAIALVPLWEGGLSNDADTFREPMSGYGGGLVLAFGALASGAISMRVGRILRNSPQTTT